MGKLTRVFILAFCLLLLTPCILAGKDITVRILLFQGTVMEGQPGLEKVEVMPLSSTPELASLKALVGGPANAFKSAAIDALMAMKNLRTLDDLFLIKQILPSPGKVMLGRQVAFRVDLLHKRLSPTEMALRVMISKTKEGVVSPEKDDRTMLRNAYNAAQDNEKMEKIVDQELVLGFDDPIIVGVPCQNRPYFMVVRLSADEPEVKPRKTPTLKTPPVSNLVPAPQPVEKVLPSYPDELKRRGVRGDVGLRIMINENGNVQMVQVVSPLHPYLDYTACQALWQWKFEPVLRNGKPVRAAFNYTFKFDPQIYSEGIAHAEDIPAYVDDATRKELERILSGCAEYCQRLADAALFYMCEETINETTHSLVSPDRLAEVLQRPRDYAVQVTESPDGNMSGWIVDSPQIISTRNVIRDTFICDYQMIKRFGDIEERRIVLKKNGRKITDRVDLLEEERFSALSPIASALAILGKDRQFLFNYRILKEDKVYGKNAVAIEALPRSGDADGVRSAKIWVDKEHLQILRSEIEGVPLDGYEDILGDAVLLNIKPFFLTKHEYRVEKNGVLFSDRTTVQVEYPSLTPNRREPKSKINLTYKDFKFFTVETETIIKK